MLRTIVLLAALLTSFYAARSQNSPEGLPVNEKAPDFKAKNQEGKTVHLYDELKKGPVVLVFYRGQWCPYCNRQLSKLEDSLQLIQDKGATLLAITPEVLENINKTIDKTKASYSILHDQDLGIMTAYKVAFEVDEKTVERYKKANIDFNVANGENGAKLPVPAVYVIGKDGRIAYRHFDPDYRKRASVAEILEHID